MVDVVRFARTLLDALGADQSTELEQLLHGRSLKIALAVVNSKAIVCDYAGIRRRLAGVGYLTSSPFL